MQEAKRAAHRAFPVTEIKSPLLSGTIALIPLKRIPTLLKFANPQSAYNIINLLFSERLYVSESDKYR